MSNASTASSRIVLRSKERLVTDLKAIVSDADTLLTEMASLTSDELAAARQRIEDKLAEVRTRIDDARIVVSRKACSAAVATSEFIEENPWKVAGVASLIGLIAAVLLMRRADK